jgi:hypothetical protein
MASASEHAGLETEGVHVALRAYVEGDDDTVSRTARADDLRLGRGPVLFALLYLSAFLIAILAYCCVSASRSYSVRC